MSIDITMMVSVAMKSIEMMIMMTMMIEVDLDDIDEHSGVNYDDANGLINGRWLIITMY